MRLISPEMASCRSCELFSQRTKVVGGEGPVPSRWAASGEGPGEKEDQTGRPFVHVAGEILDRMLVSLGLRRSEVYIVNTVRCRPPKNRAPLSDEVSACIRRWLLPELAEVRPEVVFLLGSTPSRAWLGRPISETHGKLWRVPGWDFVVYPLHHPAAHVHATGSAKVTLRQTARDDLARWVVYRTMVERGETTWTELAGPAPENAPSWPVPGPG